MPWKVINTFRPSDNSHCYTVQMDHEADLKQWWNKLTFNMREEVKGKSFCFCSAGLGGGQAGCTGSAMNEVLTECWYCSRQQPKSADGFHKYLSCFTDIQAFLSPIEQLQVILDAGQESNIRKSYVSCLWKKSWLYCHAIRSFVSPLEILCMQYKWNACVHASPSTLYKL